MDIRQSILSGKITSRMSFNQKVWALCARIPAGKVATYADLARLLKTKGYRAVGAALHRNPHAPQVPCHRVVGSDGSLTGYAGGLARKRKMLQDENIPFCGKRVNLDLCRWKG